MTEAANTNGTGAQGQGQGQQGATDYQKLYEGERSHAQHFKSEADTAKAAAKAAQEALEASKTELNKYKNNEALGDPKKLEERINSARTEAEEDAKKRYGGKIGELEAGISERDKKIQRFEVVNPGLTEAAKTFLPEAMEFVQRAIEESCALVDGKIIVKGADGKPKPSVKDPRENMGLEEFLAEYGKKNPFFLQSKVREGTMNGTEKAGSASSNTQLPAGFSTWSQEQQTQWFIKNPEAGKAVLANSNF